jgi:subtilisin family serine protease
VRNRAFKHSLSAVRSLLVATLAVLTAGAVAPVRAEPAAPTQAPLDSRAYRLSWGVRAIGADEIHARGVTGRGVTVAVIDSGLDDKARGLARHISNASADIVPGRSGAGGDRHAIYVAGTLAGSPDGMGAVGVAYDATVLSIRADSETICAKTCAFTAINLTRALDYAVSRKAQVIDLSLSGQQRLGPRFEAALARAVEAGAVVVIAAGNDGAANPAWPGRYAADPRFAGSVVAVGAVDKDGMMAAFSNRAGLARRDYLAAPGQRVVTDCDAQTCALVSGTSFAAPHVAGALALLLQAFPGMTGPDALDLLLRSASPAPQGSDAVYGRGRLDVLHAYRMAQAERGVVVVADQTR